jgi:hypothetical protein
MAAVLVLGSLGLICWLAADRPSLTGSPVVSGCTYAAAMDSVGYSSSLSLLDPSLCHPSLCSVASRQAPLAWTQSSSEQSRRLESSWTARGLARARHMDLVNKGDDGRG